MDAIPTPHDGAAESKATLKKLARFLAANYIDSSTSTNELKRNRAGTFKRVLDRKYASPISEKPHRNILVVGAGASTAAFGKDAFPAARDAMNKLDRLLDEDDTLGRRPTWINERIQEEKDRLRIAYDYKDAGEDFETHLAILSTMYSPKTVGKKLAQMYNERYWPHLAFELIGHMLKHRFIDVVINFNFDELLNQAIDEELGQSERHYIVSDGDCLDLDRLMVGDRLKVPIHVKPHGTVGHQSTLRFTKEHYFTLPEPMRLFMQKIIEGHVSDDPDAERYPTNIISVGFGMRSLDLNQILRAAATPDHPVAMFHLNTRQWYNDNIADLPNRTGVLSHELIDVYEFGDLHSTLKSLVLSVGEQFKAAYRPRGIARHEIIHKLFFNESTRCRIPAGGEGTESDAESLLSKAERRTAVSRRKLNSDADYFRARLCTELVISLAKNQRRIDLTSLFDDRVGTYFDQLRDVSQLINRRNPEAASLDRILERFNTVGGQLPLVGIEGDILTAACYDSSSDVYGAWLWDALNAVLQKLGNAEIRQRAEQLSHSAEMRGYFQALTRSDSRDINARFQHRQLLLARAPDADDVLHTNLSMMLKLSEIVNGKRGWDVLLAVSESGSVLQKCVDHIPPAVLGKKFFCMVVARSEGTSARTEILRKLPAGVSPDQVLVCELPYWLHNRHMVLGLKMVDGKPGSVERTNAIRYDRRGASNRINPVHIDYNNELDLKQLQDMFFRYVWMASEPSRTLLQIDDLEVKQQVSELQNDLLKEWWEKYQSR